MTQVFLWSVCWGRTRTEQLREKCTFLLWQFNMFDSIYLTRLIVWTLRGKAHNCKTPRSDNSDEGETAEPFRGKALSRSLAPDQALKKSWALGKHSTNHLCQNNHLQEHVGKDHFQRDRAHGMHIKASIRVLNNYCVKAKSHFQNIWKEERAETMHTALKITGQQNFFFFFFFYCRTSIKSRSLPTYHLYFVICHQSD